jgi:hypothetical protein
VKKEQTVMALDAAWRRYCSANVPLKLENREWEAFKSGWDEAVKILAAAVDGN